MKKYTKYLILSFIMVLCIMVITLGLSYSLFSYSKKGNIKNQIVTGIYNSCEYENGTEWTFNYTGSSQKFTVPCDGEYKIELWGAQGGNNGGNGAYTNGEISLNKNKKLYLYVGGMGNKNSAGVAQDVDGGYNGGGSNKGQDCCNRVFGSGGGATDVRLITGNWNNFDSLKSRIMIAAGGGGAFSNNTTAGKGGVGGALIGGDASGDYSNYCLGLGSTQISGGKISTVGKYCEDVVTYSGYTDPGMVTGKFGIGGSHGEQGNNGTGGGGGYYGGSSSGHIASAGGGSSYISGYSGCNSISINSTENSIIHTEQANHYSGYVFKNSSMVAGDNSMPTYKGTGTMTGNTGNGYAKITLVESKERYREKVLNGTDPVLADNLIPIKIASDGSVTKASIYDKWYSYENKEWANAVILKDGSKVYQNNETIPESNIESYFVWIPRYKYKIFDEGNYTGLTQIESKEQIIEVVFENKSITPSNGQTKGSYLTHPAFTSFDSNGMWVGKFETGYDGATSTSEAQVNSVATDKIIIKPNVYSWRNIAVGNAFKNSYDYMRSLDSHMMKNTEWGAVAYLQHSQYGSATSVRVNNNNALITGYAGVEEPTLGHSVSSIEGNHYEATSLGVDGTYTVNYLNSNSQAASTTGNYTGIYDMSGGSWEYVMGYNIGATNDLSELTSIYSNFFSDSNYTKYWDKYTAISNTNYNNGILGDATIELGPFGDETDPDGVARHRSSWYKDLSYTVPKSHPWYNRGGNRKDGNIAGDFAFTGNTGEAIIYLGFRIVLIPSI